MRLLVATVLALAMRAEGSAAQGYPFSQRTRIVQDVALTEVSLHYGRPVARGRALFGTLVPWDSVWHPGADSATRIAFTHDVLVEGHEVKAGEYSLWLVPHEHRTWTVILSSAAHVSHTPYPGVARDVVRFDVTPEATSHMETMAIYFPVVLRENAVMRIHWGEVAVPIRISAPYRPE